ncbi:MAG: hypothetical protein OXI60_04720 [Acidiferrobacterales bacterium]|nr:hypothetical protein [Acidiferrobacterales bacterium]
MSLSPDAQHRSENNEQQLAISLYRYLLAGIFEPGDNPEVGQSDQP